MYTMKWTQNRGTYEKEGTNASRVAVPTSVNTTMCLPDACHFTLNKRKVHTKKSSMSHGQRTCLVSLFRFGIPVQVARPKSFLCQ